MKDEYFMEALNGLEEWGETFEMRMNKISRLKVFMAEWFLYIFGENKSEVVR